ncbi:MAG: YncE family protein [Acidobacteria bacterium]|nr:MAG: YncE family protein [Acidobacteriota bacterium]
MKRKLFLSAVVFGLCCIAPRYAAAAQPLRLVATIPLNNVKGRIDHFGIDLKGKRLFMSALGNDTVEVFDLRANKRLHTIIGLHEPQGTTYAPDVNKLYVANADDGTVRIFDGTTYRLLRVLHFSSDADDTRYDAESRRVYVGYGDGAVAAIDTTDDKVLGEFKVAAHPEAYEVEKGGEKIFINVPNAHEIAVADWSRKEVVARWRLGQYSANFPMALDPGDHRLFVVTRRPAQFLVFDSNSGKMIAHVAAVGDADDIWYDTQYHRIYITVGEGFISVLAQRDADHYEPIAKIPTASGARTSFFSPELGRLYVAVPRRGNQRAELRVCATAP